MSEEMVRLSYDKLKDLLYQKFTLVGLPAKQADILADHLAYADSRGVHSHGAVRAEYYAERIDKGGSNKNPTLSFESKGPSIGILDGDNGVGHYVAQIGLEQGIEIAKETGIAFIGMKRLGHCGTLSYYLRQGVANGLIMISMCQSDPMVVLYGGCEPYFGTNPIGFGAPRKEGGPIIFDMATTVGAWGKILDARSKNESIPDDWAVDASGRPTTSPAEVAGLVPIAGSKGSGLMMMVDILCGVLLGQPSGKDVTSMYSDLSAGRELGQIHILINPDFFVGLDAFEYGIEKMITEIHAMKPAPGFEEVYYPGENADKRLQDNTEKGIPIVKSIYDYLVSDTKHYNRYDNLDAFARAKN